MLYYNFRNHLIFILLILIFQENYIYSEKHSKKKEKEKEKEKKPINAILLGFDNYEFDKSDKMGSFNIYFALIDKKKLSDELKLYLKINYEEEALRTLEDKEKKNLKVICNLKKNKQKDNKFKYKCEFKSKKKKIQSIEVINKFKFSKQNVEIKIFTPNALKYMKNIIDVGSKDIFNKKLYILKNAEIRQNRENFNLKGIIKEKKFKEQKLVLKFSTTDKKNEQKSKCSVKKLDEKNKYQLECIPKKDLSANLNGALAETEDNILIVTFKEDEDSEIFFTVPKDDDEEEKKPKKRNLKKENKENKEKKEKKEEDTNVNTNTKNEESSSFLSNEVIINIITIIIIILLICLFFISLLQNKNKSPRSIPDNTPMKKIKISKVNIE